MHTLLNHPQTPREVLACIIGHELLHLLHPPRRIGGRWVSHTPEFRAAEQAHYPDTETAHAWINLALGAHLCSDWERQCIVVRGDWQARGLGCDRPGWGEAQRWVRRERDQRGEVEDAQRLRANQVAHPPARQLNQG